MIVFDLDGTLSLVGSRQKHLTQKPKDWDKFYNKCGEDKPNEPIVEIYCALKATTNKRVVIMTSRRANERTTTLEWFKRYNIPLASEDLYMRPYGDMRRDVTIKREMLDTIKEPIDMVFEDRQCMIDFWRSRGIVCLQVAPGKF